MAIPLSSHGPSAVFTPPRGLQSFLGTQAIGLNPDKLPEFIQGGLDLFPFLAYGRGYRSVLASGSLPVALAPNAIGSVQVGPAAGKIWIPIFAHALVLPGAGGQVRAQLCIVETAGVFVAWTPYPVMDFNATQVGNLSLNLGYSFWENPLVVPAGYAFNLVTNSVAVTDATYDLRVTFLELDA